MATAKARRRGGGIALETKNDAGSAPATLEIKALQDQTAKLLEQVNQATSELNATEKKDGSKDGLTEAKADRVIAALQTSLSQIAELKKQADALEVKANRPPIEGRADADEEYEAKSGGGDFKMEYKSAFLQFAQTGSRSGFEALERKDMSTLSDPQGGYFVPEEIDTEINRILLDSGGFREVARIRTVSSQSYKKRALTKGVNAAWTGEKDARDRTKTPEYDQIEIHTGELYARPAITQTLLEDVTIDIEAEIAQEVAEAFSLLENDAFLNGDGVNGKPRGLLTYTFAANGSVKSWGEFGFIASGSTSGIAKVGAGDELDKLIDLQHALKPGYRNGASWIMNDSVMAYLRKIKDAQGNPILQTIMASGITTLLGSPINIVQEMPDMASNKLSIGYGVWERTYTIVDRLGSSIDRFYDSNTAPFVEFYTRKRLGGGVEQFETAKFMKFTA